MLKVDAAVCMSQLATSSDQLLQYIAANARNMQELNLCGVKSVSADVWDLSYCYYR